MRYLLIATMLALASEASGSWGGGQCFAQSGPVWVVRPVKKAAKKKPKAKAKKCPCKDCECAKTGKCSCTPKSDCKCKDCPDKPKEEAKIAAPLNFGIIQEDMQSETRHSINGHPATKEEVIKLLEQTADPKLPDDAGKLHFTVIDADKAVRERVVKDVAEHPAFSGIRDQLHVQAYDPNNWAVSTERAGFVPSIYLQVHDSPPLLRVEKYPGPEKMAELVTEEIGKLRRRDPKYNPKDDPDGSKKAGSDTMLMWLGALALLGVVAAAKK